MRWESPVLAARIDAMRAKGGNPFMELQLPQAILQLKQGAGRLIRDGMGFKADRDVDQRHPRVYRGGGNQGRVDRRCIGTGP